MLYVHIVTWKIRQWYYATRLYSNTQKHIWCENSGLRNVTSGTRWFYVHSILLNPIQTNKRFEIDWQFRCGYVQMFRKMYNYSWRINGVFVWKKNIGIGKSYWKIRSLKTKILIIRILTNAELKFEIEVIMVGKTSRT